MTPASWMICVVISEWPWLGDMRGSMEKTFFFFSEKCSSGDWGFTMNLEDGFIIFMPKIEEELFSWLLED